MGYTEKSIQRQLKRFLQERFEHVVEEHGVQGYNATKIDFDLGAGKVGLEVKLAESAFKTSEMHRLHGQLVDYKRLRYKDDNLLVAVFTEERHRNDRPRMKELAEKVQLAGARIIERPIEGTVGASA